MRTRTILASVAAFFVGVGLCAADDPQMGTWKLNEGKSKLNPDTTKNTSVVYAPAGDSVKVTVDGVDKDGKPTHSEWTGTFDGKDYAVTGDPTSDTRSYKKVDDHTLSFSAKKGAAVTLTGRIVVAADGKSRTVTTAATGEGGKKLVSIAFYEKQ